MAMATNAIVRLFSSIPCSLLPAPSRKGNSVSLSFATRRSFDAVGSRLSWRGEGKRMTEIARFSSNTDQKSEESGDAGSADEDFLPPDDVDYLFKLIAGSVGGGAAVKYGSILFPDLTKPNLLQALLMVSLPVLVASIILIKESYSTK